MIERRTVPTLAAYATLRTSHSTLFFLKKNISAGVDTADRKEESRDSGKSGNDGDDKERTTAEWVTLGVSILIVAAIVGLVLYQYAAGGTRSPQIMVEPLIGEVTQLGDYYYLPISITNSGDKAAEAVEIEIEHVIEGEEPEAVSFTVPFLAGMEKDQYTVILSGNPGEGELSHTVSFHEP